jgi:hypothetical protein
MNNTTTPKIWQQFISVWCMDQNHESCRGAYKDRKIDPKQWQSCKCSCHYTQDNWEEGETRDKLADFLGISHGTLAKEEAIVEAVEQDQSKILRSLENY